MRPPRAARLLFFAGLAILLLLHTDPAFAWTAVMDEKIIREAVRLMPPALRDVLASHGQDLADGARRARDGEGASDHRLEPGQKAPSAADRVEGIVAETVAMIDGHRPFSEVAQRMGELAHFVGDLNNPLQASAADPREAAYASDYAQYVESNLDRFPLVFYGWTDPRLDLPGLPARRDLRSFAEASAGRARRYYGPVSRAYDPGNREPLSRRFDVRSLPFGIGSLSYSRAVTDTARLWLHIWHRAHGDTRGTPYLAQEAAARSARADTP